MPQETKDYILSETIRLYNSGLTDAHLIRHEIQYDGLRADKEFYTNDTVYAIVLEALATLQPVEAPVEEVL